MTYYFIYKSYSQGIKDDGQRYYLNKRVKEDISEEETSGKGPQWSEEELSGQRGEELQSPWGGNKCRRFQMPTLRWLPKCHSSEEPSCRCRRCRFPGLGRSPGGGNGSPLQHSCLENSMDRGARRATILGIMKSQTRLSTQGLDSRWDDEKRLSNTVKKGLTGGKKVRDKRIQSINWFVQVEGPKSFG